MKRPSAPLIIAASLLLCACSRKDTHAKRPSVDPPQQVQPEDQVIKAATPEDPGPVANVVGPLSAWQQQGKLEQAQKEEEQRTAPQAVDRAISFDAGDPQHFLHKVFSVSSHAQFAFVVPPHQDSTRLRGTFRSFTNRRDPDATNDRTANVDLTLLNEQQFNEFLHGEPQSVTYELDSAHNQLVEWRVPTTYADPQTYHLVFSNSEGVKTKFVEADFTVSFQ
jgi:hypothetical protein